MTQIASNPHEERPPFAGVAFLLSRNGRDRRKPLHPSDSQIAYPPQGEPARTNDLGCSDQPKLEDEERDSIRLGQEAWRRLRNDQSWDDWVLVGEALLIGRAECMRAAHTNKPEGRRYNEEFSDWLKTNKFDEIDKGTRSRLLDCLAKRSEIEKWRATLPTSERLKLNYPTAVLRRWQRTQVKKPDDAKPVSAVAKLKATIIDLEEQNHRLRQNAPFTPQDKPNDIAGYIFRTIQQTPRLARSIARALEKLAKAAEEADRQDDAA